MYEVHVCVCCFFKLIFSQLFFIMLTFALVINIWIFARAFYTSSSTDVCNSSQSTLKGFSTTWDGKVDLSSWTIFCNNSMVDSCKFSKTTHSSDVIATLANSFVSTIVIMKKGKLGPPTR